MHIRYAVFFVFTALVTLPSAVLHAQDISFSAEATPEKVGVNDAVQLTYMLENAGNLQSLELAPSKDFDVIGGPMDSHGSSVSIVNGKRSQKTTFSRTYVLRPTRTGRLRTPEGVAQTEDGKVFRSNTTTVEVVKGSVAPQQRSAPRQDPLFSDPFFQSPFATPPPPSEPPVRKIWNPQPGRDLFIRASISKPRAYVGEAVVVNYRLYSRVTVQAQLTKLPQAEGAWTEEIPTGEPLPRDETVNGQPYRSVLIKSLLMYPQQTGVLTLPAAEVEGYAQSPDEAMGGMASLFGDPSLGAVPVRLNTDAVSLTVLPLPGAGKPQGFEGAVGVFTLEAVLDKASITTDASATLTLTLRGPGAGRLTPVPRPAFPAGVDAYEPTARDSTLADGTGIKVVRYALSAREAGTFTIPSIELPYFDPQRNAYRAAWTQPLTLEVKQGSNPKSVASISKSGSSSGWLGKGLMAVGAASFAGAVAYLLVKKRKTPAAPAPGPESVHASSVPASVTISSPLVLSQSASTPLLLSANTHADVLRIFRQRLSEILDLPASGVSKASVLRALSTRVVPDDVQEKVHGVWQQCEAAVYAPGGLGAEQSVSETAQDAVAALDQIQMRLAA